MRRTASRLALALSLLLGASFAFVPLAASAQDFTSVTPLTLTADPQYPHPYASISVTPTSTVTSLSSMTLSWTVNGKSAGTTTGGASFAVQLGGPGSKTTVAATATGGGSSFSASLTLQPADVELIAEPQTTVHPLYEGSPLIGSQAPVRFVAIADARTSAGVRIDPSKLIYDWKLDDQELQDQSGVGVNTLTLEAPVMYRTATLYVTVSGADGTIYGQDSFGLSPIEPTMRLYVNDPLEGPLYDQALPSSYAMPGVEQSFIAVPYSFSTTPSISWTIGGQPSSAGPVVTVRSSGNGSGNAAIAAQAVANQLEIANAESDVSFQGTQSGGGILNLFGL